MTISSPESGISLEVDTTSPGLQFYSGNMLGPDNPVSGKGGVAYPQYGGFAVETQVHCLMPGGIAVIISAHLQATVCASCIQV